MADNIVEQESFGKRYAHLGYEQMQLRVGSYVIYISRNKRITSGKLAEIVQKGLDENEKCLFAGSEKMHAELTGILEKNGKNLDKMAKHGQFQYVSDKNEFFPSGEFSIESFLSSLQNHIDDTCLQGWSSLRFILDFHWLFSSKNSKKNFIEKEIELFNGFSRKRLSLFFIGFVMANQITPGGFFDLINSHSLVMLDGNFLNNSYVESTNFDNLTGLFNQEHFQSLLKKEVIRCKRYNRQCSVVIFDIDDFKHINRQFGYAKGDNLLMEMSNLLLSNIRSVDILGRLGGEEFSVILPETEKNGGILMAKRMLSITANKLFVEDMPVTLSAGIAGYPNDTLDHLLMLNRAKEALNRAKLNGRGNVDAFEESCSIS